MYKHFGEGGIGNILTGNIMLDYDQLEAPGNMIIPLSAEFSGPRFEAFKELATAAKAQGSLIVGQISHPGRQVQDKIQKDPVSASDVQLEGVVFGQTFAKPHAATQEEIDVIVNTFAHSAEFLDRAGYSGIELHGAHGTFASILQVSKSKHTKLTKRRLSPRTIPLGTHQSPYGQIRRLPHQPLPYHRRDRTRHPIPRLPLLHPRHQAQQR
jgi:hypothetical protein